MGHAAAARCPTSPVRKCWRLSLSLCRSRSIKRGFRHGAVRADSSAARDETVTPLTVVVVGAAGAAAVGLFVLTARHPLAGCAALALTVPLTAGLARGALIPMLKPGEAILVIVLAGVVAHRLTTHRVRPVGGLDLAVGAYAIGSVAIP